MLDSSLRRTDHPDLVCLSHLRWNFVFQRPQHLLTRAARNRRVFFFEEPEFVDGAVDLELREDPSGVRIAVPLLPHGTPREEQRRLLRMLLDGFLERESIRYVLWYYTPMALDFSSHLHPDAIVFDCMDELSAFAGAPPEMVRKEADLLSRADLVFTGGQSLFEAKTGRHRHVHLFPSSIDVPHFGRARTVRQDPPDQAPLPRPRLGYFGVIDERMDLALIAEAASHRPAWQFVFIGPVVKIDPATLPQRENIHYLGMKKYEELPTYIAGWDVALLPFARNEATRFISPTKTPEYLAAGCPVVSTAVRDVVRPYGEEGLVWIADEPRDFVDAAEAAMRESRAVRLARVDKFLAGRSWDRTWAEMDASIAEALESKAIARRPIVPVTLNTPVAARPLPVARDGRIAEAGRS